jgi:hypothetical protein
MNKKTAALIASVITIVVLFFVIRSQLKQGEDDEQLLLGLIDQAAAAAEKREIKFLKGVLSAGYRDSAGRGHKEIIQLLTWQFLRGGTISVYILDKTALVNRAASPRTATAKVQAVITRGAKVKRLSDIVPDQARSLTFDLSFKKEDDDWRLTAAQWTDNPNLRELLK